MLKKKEIPACVHNKSTGSKENFWTIFSSKFYKEEIEI